MSAAATEATTTGHEVDDVARLRLAIVRLGRRQRQRSGTGLSVGLQSALAVVDAAGPLTLGELAAAERVAPPTITRIVAKLEEEGLLTRHGDPDDGRRFLLAITEEGASRLAASRDRRNAWLSARLDQLSAADRKKLMAAIGPLERLVEIDDIEPEPGQEPQS